MAAPLKSLPADRLDRLVRAWLRDGRMGVAGHLHFLVCLLVICGSAAYIGVPWLYKYAADVFLFLDGGWRVLQGQRPHLDFYTGIGPVTYLIDALGLKLSGLEPRGLGIGSGLFALVVGLWTYRIGLRRMRPPSAAIASLFLALLAVGPFALGEWPTDTGFAMVYNRYGYALVGLIIIEVFKPVRGAEQQGREILIGGFSTGLACGVLLFLKVSFFLGSLPLIALGLLFRTHARAAPIGALLLGFTASVSVFLWYLRFDLAAMWGDMVLNAGARHADISAIRALLLSSFDICGLIVLVVLARALQVLQPIAAGGFISENRQTIFGLVTVLVGGFLLFTNHQAYGMPLNALFAILVAEEIPSLAKGTPRTDLSVLCSAAVLGVALLVALPTFGSDSMALGYSVFRQMRSAEALGAGMSTKEPRLAGLWFVGEHPRYNTIAFLQDLEDGTSLLRRSSRPEETVYSMDFSNPFAYALGRRPVRGGCWTFGWMLNFNEVYHPSSERVFGGADIVMEPKVPISYLGGVMVVYGSYLRQHFRLAAESPSWLMYRRFQ
jgi:hypothetical protein